MSSQEIRIAALILALKHLDGVGPKTIQNLLRQCGEQLRATSDYGVDFLKWLGISQLTKAIDKTSISWSERLEMAAESISVASGSGQSVLHPLSNGYPRRLLCNESFPVLLFVQGDVMSLDSDKQVAIVGTRTPTNYGSTMIRRVSEKVAHDGYVIVSGLALGSDSIAHQGALSGGGATVAVLPKSLDDQIYPRQNQKLAEQILDTGGTLVSEYEPGALTHGRKLIANLIARDEWQSGLADGLIAAETSVTGGTNHAIKHAIRTGTPLGMFDYTSMLEPDMLGVDWYSGNKMYLESQQAFPISSPESINAFEDLMEEYRRRNRLNSGTNQDDRLTAFESMDVQQRLF